jgi:BON domain
MKMMRKGAPLFLHAVTSVVLRMHSARLVKGVVASIAALTFAVANAEPPRTYQLDPFSQATSGYAACPSVKPPVLDEQQMRAQAHSRAERGTSCCLTGTCECGGAYKRDPEINDRVIEALRRDARFRDTSVWATTTRGFVTLQGCVHNASQKSALERLVKRQEGVALVWNETAVPPLRSGERKR